MPGYILKDLYYDVAEVQHESLDRFGSGRLIGTNLILTARHVVKDGDDPLQNKWKIRLWGMKPKTEGEKWQWIDGEVIWVGKGKLDLALIGVRSESAMVPRLRLHVATILEANAHKARGVGFPLASREDGRRKLVAPSGQIIDQDATTLAWAIDNAYVPEAPDEDWPGFSGASIFHADRIGEMDLWLYGVAQQVPAKFKKQLDVARLSEALKEANFHDHLRSAEVSSCRAADTTKMPAADDFPHVKYLVEWAKSQLPSDQSRQFMTEVALCETQEEIERLHRAEERGPQGFNPQQMVARFSSGAHILMQAPGGLGKSFYLFRLLLAAIDEGYVPFYLDVSGAKFNMDPSDEACAALFGEAAKKGGNWKKFESAKSKVLRVLVAVDSLNEAVYPERIEKTLGHLCENYGDNLFLIASDRLSGKRSAFAKTLVTILPLRPEFVTTRLKKLQCKPVGEKFLKLLSTPFFLHLYEDIIDRTSAGRAPFTPQTRAHIMFAYFAICNDSHTKPELMIKRGKDIVGGLAPVAFEAYRAGEIRMRHDWLSDKIKNTKVNLDELTQAGMLTKAEKGETWFRHQLFHDFLAGFHLSCLKCEEWRSENFDIATLGASSSDALDFAIELAHEKASDLIIEIYDWNYGAAFKCILDMEAGVAGKSSPLSDFLRDAFIVLNSEKRFDFFRHTRTKA